MSDEVLKPGDVGWEGRSPTGQPWSLLRDDKEPLRWKYTLALDVVNTDHATFGGLSVGPRFSVERDTWIKMGRPGSITVEVTP